MLITSIAKAVVKFLGSISWKLTDPIIDYEKQKIRELLTDNYYIILTRGNNHLSTYAIAFSDLILRGKWGYWAHALMNLEDDVESDEDFRLIQATRVGVKYTTLDELCNTNSIVLLKPTKMKLEEWTAVLDKAKSQLGKPYDSLYDLANDNALSCVELVRSALQGEPNYATDFADFERMITESRNLTPQMFYDCADFEVVYEARH